MSQVFTPGESLFSLLPYLQNVKDAKQRDESFLFRRGSGRMVSVLAAFPLFFNPLVKS